MKQRKKVMLVFGTRPEAIKMYPVYKALRARPEDFDTRVCITGQHREMLHQVMDLFEMQADYDLAVMKPGQDLYDVTSNVLLGLRDVYRPEKPDMVLVHGDTTTTFTASLAAFYEKIEVGHVEAGLRTGNIYSPWPEEMNRKLTGAIAKYHFAPTERNKQNLLSEGVSEDQIFVTGNTVIDALLEVENKLKNQSEIQSKVLKILQEQSLRFCDAEWFADNDRKLILVTGHRRENFGEGMQQICQTLKSIALDYPNYQIVYPVHLNPNVQEPVYSLLGGINNLHLIKPLDYLPFVALMSKARLILTDSGGIQEEAPALGVPVLVMRDTTERPEAVEVGTAQLVGTNHENILPAVQDILAGDYDPLRYKTINPYGNGESGYEIIAHISSS
tara:strand:+ start:794 stop:1957 length:1164 start_codon:yes stop_codon:yes gene_type:complete